MPPTQSPLLITSSAPEGPLSSSRTIPYLRSAPSVTVIEQEKPDTARRASGDSTAFGQINRTVIPLNAEESQLSSSRTGSEPSAPLGLRQRPSGAAKVHSGHFSPLSDGVTRPGSVGPNSSQHQGPSVIRKVHCRPPKPSPTARHRRALTLLLSIQRRRWSCSGRPSLAFRFGPHRRLS